jgi:heme/copper-type cytochrome/quinol oxidase subunit 2
MTDEKPTGASTPRQQRDAVVAAQKERFGGMKLGSAFFGWLTATGLAVLLTALLSAVGAGVGVANDADAAELADQAAQDPGTVGLVGGIVLAVILFVAYFAGGYVAGRMARFDGAKQGVAVWLWAVVIAVLLAVVGIVAGNQFNVLSQLNGFPRIPVDEGTLTTGGIIALVVTAIITLVGAVLGGLAGMRYHRRVDQADVDRRAGIA